MTGKRHMRDKFTIDTNILFYTVDNESDKQEKARNFLARSRFKEASITLRALAECYNLSIKRNQMETQKAYEFIHNLKHDKNFEILQSDKRSLNRAIEKQEDFWDRMIESTALENGYNVIYTENTSDFSEIEAINPLK